MSQAKQHSTIHSSDIADVAADAVKRAVEARQQAGIELSGEQLNSISGGASFYLKDSDAEPWVLHGVNMSIHAGESVAISGPSGCGRTTLLKVMLDLLPATEGEVLIGGKNVRQLGARYRAVVGTVMQEGQLFAGSLADNICFFDAAPDQARIETCARMASIHQDIVTMPMGYNTLIGDMGTTLSGGQKQRVVLARALYKQPKILALDEATSHLDVVRERQVSDAIKHLQLTRVIIAHRPETIATADRVFILGQLNPQTNEAALVATEAHA